MGGSEHEYSIQSILDHDSENKCSFLSCNSSKLSTTCVSILIKLCPLTLNS